MRKTPGERAAPRGLTGLPSFEDRIEDVIPAKGNAGENEGQRERRSRRLVKCEAQNGPDKCNGENFIQDGLEHATGSGTHWNACVSQRVIGDDALIVWLGRLR